MRQLSTGQHHPCYLRVRLTWRLRRNMALRHALGEWRRRGAASALAGALAAPALSMTGHAVGAAHNTVTQVGRSPLAGPCCAVVASPVPSHICTWVLLSAERLVLL